MTSNKQFKNLIYKAHSESFSTCFFPVKPKCSEQAIKAHSIQKQGVLEELTENGHVIVLNPIQDLENVPQLEFRSVGRKQATTFTGLCNKHDTDLFRPIDLNPINISSDEHLFLLSYRSVLRQLHAQCLTARKVQKAYSESVELGYCDAKEVDYPMMLSNFELMKAYEFSNYSRIWDEAYLNSELDQVKHQTIRIPSTKATFAVSSVYSLVDNINIYKSSQVSEYIAFNVFPYKNDVVAIWSYPAFQHNYFASHLDELSRTEGDYRKYILSKLVLRYCENFVLAPSFYKSLSQQQIESITKYYFANAYGEVDYEDKNLFLF